MRLSTSYNENIYKTGTTLPPKNASPKTAEPAASKPNSADSALNAAKAPQQQFATQSMAALLSVQEDDDRSPQEKRLDAMFANKNDENQEPRNLEELPELLLPSASNISAIAKHASARFAQMLKQYGIEEAPATISFDRDGQMQLPQDYEHADELKAALEENPGLKRELSTLNALTSHFVELQKREPMYKELSSANSQSEIDRIIQKYLQFLQDSGDYSQTSLALTKDGQITPMSDGKAVRLA